MAHHWKFFRAGGFEQVRLDTGADLAALGELDQKLWVALSCPTAGLEFDPRTLELCDTDKDGRIRVAEILAATRWTLSCLKSRTQRRLLRSPGRDWDATIVKLVDNPISIRQAFWSPYKKFVRMIESQIERVASAKEKAVDESAGTNISAAGTGSLKKDSFDVAKFAGIFAAIGLAMGAIGGVLGALLASFTSLLAWQMPLAVLGGMLAISTPSMILASLKLRQRNLGPLLDANGWAINARALINIPFGRSLTAMATLPPGSHRDLSDPYAESKAGRRLALAVALVVGLTGALWFFGVLNRVMPFLPESSFVASRARAAPASVAPAPVEPAPAAR